LQEYRPPKSKAPRDLEYVWAFFRSTYRLGLVDKDRWNYWKLLFWTIFHHPGHLPMAITLAIYGFHFRKICELHAFGQLDPAGL
jgi:hypothetical protein